MENMLMSSKQDTDLINYIKGKENILIEKALAEFVTRVQNDVCTAGLVTWRGVVERSCLLFWIVVLLRLFGERCLHRRAGDMERTL
jgi:hypothetical protein